MRACGQCRPEGTWVTSNMLAAYTELHRLGHAHSVESWVKPDGDSDEWELAGGTYGLSIGGLFAAESMFYRVTDGGRRLFNHTDPQQYEDASLPPTSPWSSQAFLTQAVPLARFQPGAYELEIVITDRRTRATAKGTVAFTVVPEVR